jgi:hypothetical protein
LLDSTPNAGLSFDTQNNRQKLTDDAAAGPIAVDVSALGETWMVAAIPRGLFRNPNIRPIGIAVAAALAASIGRAGTATINAVTLAEMVGVHPETVRDELRVLSRFAFWGRKLKKRNAVEWWIIAPQMAFPFAESYPQGAQGKAPRLYLDAQGKARELYLGLQGKAPRLYLDDGAIRSQLYLTDLIETLENDLGISGADAPTVADTLAANGKGAAWVREWASLWPFLRKPVTNKAGWLVAAATNPGKYPMRPALIAARDRAREAAERDELAKRRAARPTPPPAIKPAIEPEPPVILTPDERRAALPAAMRRRLAEGADLS